MERLCLSVWTAIVVGVGLCSSVSAAGASSAERLPTVVLISMDGTRPADVTPELLPSLVALAERGTQAERLLPAFPSNTFPNHVTMVTGVAPERHGLVDNSFIDAERGAFDKQDIASWIEVEPLWSQLERQGVVTASFYWVGSEGTWPGGRAPRYRRPFSGKTPEAEKVDQILAWLDLPPADRPQLITSWFHGADHAAHVYGPGTPEVASSLAPQDRAIARLVAGIDARDLWATTTLLVVSDHGMALAKNRVDVGSALAAAGIDATVLGIGGFASVHLRMTGDAASRAATEAQALSVLRERGLAAWRRGEAPERLRLDHARFGDLVVVAPIGTAIVHETLVLTGFHGYEPEVPEMAAILIAAGRGVRPGAKLPVVRNVDVAPTVLALLGAPVPAWMEGVPIAGLAPTGSAGLARPEPMTEHP